MRIEDLKSLQEKYNVYVGDFSLASPSWVEERIAVDIKTLELVDECIARADKMRIYNSSYKKKERKVKNGILNIWRRK